MQALRTIVGALIGGGLAAAVLVLLAVITDREAVWPVVVMGIVSGLAMRWLAGQGGASYFRGALAAVVAIAAFVLGKYAMAAILLTNSNQMLHAAAQAGEVEPVPGKKPAAGGLGPVAAVENAPLVGPPERGAGTSPRNTFALIDAILLYVGALIAYELGKGRPKPPVVSSPETAAAFSP